MDFVLNYSNLPLKYGLSGYVESAYFKRYTTAIYKHLNSISSGQKSSFRVFRRHIFLNCGNWNWTIPVLSSAVAFIYNIFTIFQFIFGEKFSGILKSSLLNRLTFLISYTEYFMFLYAFNPKKTQVLLFLVE